MPGVKPFIARPSRFGYVAGGLLLLLDVVGMAIIQLRGLVEGPGEAALAVVIVGGIALYALSEVLVSAVARVVVDDDAVEVRNQIGRRKRFAATEVGHALRRSVFSPAESGIYQEQLLLIAKDGRRLARLWESDYGSASLKRVVESLGLSWPEPETASKRNRGAIAAVVILAVIAVGLGVIAFAMLTH